MTLSSQETSKVQLNGNHHSTNHDRKWREIPSCLDHIDSCAFSHSVFKISLMLLLLLLKTQRKGKGKLKSAKQESAADQTPAELLPGPPPELARCPRRKIDAFVGNPCADYYNFAKKAAQATNASSG